MNQDRRTDARDLVQVRARTAAGAYSPFFDPDGSGSITAADYLLVRTNIGGRTPAVPDPVAAATTVPPPRRGAPITRAVLR